MIKALDLQDCIVSIDVMGCQHVIVDETLEVKADYILAVKNNQQELYESIEDAIFYRFSFSLFLVDAFVGVFS